MVQKKIALPATGAGILLAGGLAGRRLVTQWRSNPDPLDGLSVEFPAGEERRVTLADGAEIATVSVGDGPTILLVHGLTASRHDWGPMSKALLNAGYQLVAIDQRGHGDSTAGTAGYGSTQLGRDLAAVIAELDLRPVALVGHSMGGMAAMAYVVDHLDDAVGRVGSLVLLATAGSLDTARHWVGLRLGSISIPEAIVPENEKLRVGAGLGVFGAKPSLRMVDEAVRAFLRCPEDVRQAATAALLDHDVLDRLRGVNIPALVVGGTRDRLIGPHQVEALAEALPNSRLDMLKGAGHMLHWERHEHITNSIVDFLRANSLTSLVDRK